MDLINESWHWSLSGVMIVFVMFLLIYLGKRFGVSSSFKAMCSALGAGNKISYFSYNWKSHDWLFLFVVGAILGGLIASNFMPNQNPMELGDTTKQYLSDINVSLPSNGEMAPPEIFSLDGLKNPTYLIMLIIGGLLIGFGTRYAGGCTSGHAITGLSNLQLPSLVAVIGFFIGGLTMTYFILPTILS